MKVTCKAGSVIVAVAHVETTWDALDWARPYRAPGRTIVIEDEDGNQRSYEEAARGYHSAGFKDA